MQELSMNILDVAENSVSAGASLVEITLLQDTAQGTQTLTVKDNGRGMSPQMVQTVTDPFTTTRTTRKVGLGLPFLKMAAEQTGGGMSLESEEGKGTTVCATFTLGHIDLMPLGDIGGTISALCAANPDADIVFTFGHDASVFSFDTRDARKILEGVPFSEPSVSVFIREHVNEGVQEALGGESES